MRLGRRQEILEKIENQDLKRMASSITEKEILQNNLNRETKELKHI